MNLLDIILIAVSAIAAAAGIILTVLTDKKIKEHPEKKLKKRKKLAIVLSIAGSWLFIVKILSWIFGSGESEEFTLSLAAERTELFGYSVSQTVLVTWVIIAIVFLLALIFRIFAVPRFKDKPTGLQNLMEIAVENIEK